MKITLQLFMMSTMLMGNGRFEYTQNDLSDKKKIQLVKDFYTAHITAWATTKNNYVLIKKLDSLQKKYCSLSLRNKLRQDFKENQLDNDLLTNNEGSNDKSLKTLTVTRDSSKTNAYIISYAYSTITPSYKPIIKKIIIHVTVIKEKEEFKIDTVW